jgi:hypothetical protein
LTSPCARSSTDGRDGGDHSRATTHETFVEERNEACALAWVDDVGQKANDVGARAKRFSSWISRLAVKSLDLQGKCRRTLWQEHTSSFDAITRRAKTRKHGIGDVWGQNGELAHVDDAHDAFGAREHESACTTSHLVEVVHRER